jgi:anti-sigma B factor antagonist
MLRGAAHKNQNSLNHEGGLMSLKISVTEKSQGISNIAIAGTLDATTHPELDKEIDKILKASPNVIILDMEKLVFISSAGLRIIAKVKKSLKETGGNLMLVNLQPQIREVFDIINALPSEQIFASVKELDDYLISRQQMNIEARKAL